MERVVAPGVYLRGKDRIRIDYTYHGQRVRRTLRLPHTPEGIAQAKEMREALASRVEWVASAPCKYFRREIGGYFKDMFHAARKRAEKNGLEYALTEGDESRLIDGSCGACAVTGIPFSLKRWDFRRRPFAPSLDRISNSEGYTPGNTRLICVAANYALNEWGEEVFETVARGYMKTTGARPRIATVPVTSTEGY